MIANGDFELSRVDIAGNYRMPNVNLVNKVVREIGWNWHQQNKYVSNYPDQSAYLNQHSKRWTLKFYNKFQQMVSSKKEFPFKDKLLEYVKRMVRSELTLRSPELKSRNLNRGSDWADCSLPIKLLQQALNKDGINGQIKFCLLPEEVDRLSSAMKRIYISWSHGESIKELYGIATYYRAAQQFKKLKINISNLPHKNRTQLVKLAEVLVEENIATFPKYAKKMGLIFIPRRKKTT